jgi:hypothetical protein
MRIVARMQLEVEVEGKGVEVFGVEESGCGCRAGVGDVM